MPLQNASDKKKLNYKKNMDMFKRKIEQVEEEDIVEVSPEIGVPILQKLSYVKNDDIAELFTSLLASASSINTCSLVHPGFINVIENLSVDEAKILQYLSNISSKTFPFIYLEVFFTNSASVIVNDFLTNLENVISLLFPENIPLYLSNLVSQGLLIINHTSYLARPGVYDDLNNSYKSIIESEETKYRDMQLDLSEGAKFEDCQVKKGYCELTKFALSFTKVCIR
ncbi:hypothetical protein ACV242_003140 [Peribacillus simplex]